MSEAQHGFTRTAAKKALAPLAHAAVTAGTAYLTRKAMQLWREKLQPKVEQRGARAVAQETLKNVADKAGAVTSSNRETQRRQRKQRRDQRRRALEKSGSS